MKIAKQFAGNFSNFGDIFDWERRTAEIKQGSEVVFRQENVEVPKHWSQMATNIVASKYFNGGGESRESSVRALIHRVVRTIANWGVEDGYFNEADGETFYNELGYLCTSQIMAFNSPVWFNVGLFQARGLMGSPNNWVWDSSPLAAKEDRVVPCQNPYEYPQASACFIQGVEDDMQSIMKLAVNEAMLFKYGSGTGTDLSTLRSSREVLSGGGKPSGPLSFMRVYDQVAEVVRSGGVTRRAAKMQSMKDWHPDIFEFIECKTKQEIHARALIDKGIPAQEAYGALLYQNANLSVRLSDEFMQAVVDDLPWQTRWVTDPSKNGPTYKAREIFRRIAECAWESGDPGVQYDTTINDWHTCPAAGRINASNPCGEYTFIDDSACNLASINLMKFLRPDGKFDYDLFGKVVRLTLIAMDILVDRSSYPTKEICFNAHSFRTLGLGYTNLGALLMAMGLAYDSDEGRDLCGNITGALQAHALATSAEMARELAPFDDYKNNAATYAAIVKRYADQFHYNNENVIAVWNELLKNEHGYRNAQVTVLAPTGTISFMMDCDTTGIEPELSLIRYKQLVGGGTLRLVNTTVVKSLKRLGYSLSEIKAIVDYIDKNETLKGSTIKPEHLPVFACSLGDDALPWEAHVFMMAAAQPFISGAISKTINMPKESTPADIEKVYLHGWKLGLKSMTIYRDGSKGYQPMTTKKVEAAAEVPATKGKRRERLPDTRDSITHKFSLNGNEGYFTVGLYPDGRPGELFISIAKEGSTVSGLLGCFGMSISICLQYGVPLSVLVNKFSYMRFEPQGFTTNPDIRIAHSVVDYIFRWLSNRFETPVETVKAAEEATAKPVEAEPMSLDGPVCDSCGSLTKKVGGCHLCYCCGTSGGCS